MAPTSKLQRIRKRMFKDNPNCPFCNVLMVLPESLSDSSRGQNNMCTIEHIYSRLNPLRNRNNRNEIMILCMKCNANKARAEEKVLGLNNLQKRSKIHQNIKRNELIENIIKQINYNDTRKI